MKLIVLLAGGDQQTIRGVFFRTWFWANVWETLGLYVTNTCLTCFFVFLRFFSAAFWGNSECLQHMLMSDEKLQGMEFTKLLADQQDWNETFPRSLMDGCGTNLEFLKVKSLQDRKWHKALLVFRSRGTWGTIQCSKEDVLVTGVVCTQKSWLFVGFDMFWLHSAPRQLLH